MAISEAREPVHHSYGGDALCLGCNYSLRGLTDARCPECGREFDLDDPKSFNRERPLTWLDRMLLKPIGWPTFLAVGLVCGWFLKLALHPDIYYLGMHLGLALLLLLPIAAVLGGRNLLRSYIPPRSIRRVSTKRRERFALGMFGLTFLLVVFHVPLRVVFFLAKPELDRVAQGIEDGTLTLPLNGHRAGPIVLSSNVWYGHKDQYFFNMQPFGGGIAYCRIPGQPLYYNSGADGHLWGNWYWWIDD